MQWIMLTYSLPTSPNSSLRVSLWRRLKRTGAVSVAGGSYLLPARDSCREAFQWLAQEVHQAQGEALLLHVSAIEGLSDGALVELFHDVRRKDYAEIAAQLAPLEQEPAADQLILEAARETVSRLRRRHAEIARIDYFDTPEGQQVAGRLGRLAQALMSSASRGKTPSLTTAAYQGRRWVTRPRPHIDRIACVWLIRRFVDPAAAVRYADVAAPDEVAFDMPGATFGHQGSRCSFETMLAAFDLVDPGLHALAELVHALDLSDEQVERPEGAGVEAILRGWLQLGLNDAELERHGVALFEGLYTSMLAQAERLMRRQAVAEEAQVEELYDDPTAPNP